MIYTHRIGKYYRCLHAQDAGVLRSDDYKIFTCVEKCIVKFDGKYYFFFFDFRMKHFLSTLREAKFKRAPRVHFLTYFTKNFCRFLIPKVKSGTDMINPSIESSDFLFWHEKNLESDF